jgi:voltage-gated potassium channel
VDRHAPSKLIKAGANKTISATDIGGKRMATLALRPAIVSFLDVMTQLGDMELDLEDVQIHSGSQMIQKTLSQLKIPIRVGLIVIAIQKYSEDKTQFNPGSQTLIELGDRLMVLGTPEQVTALRIMAKDVRHE